MKDIKRIEQLTESAIQFIKKAEPLALRMDERGFHVAFSGGKDSQVILKLVEMANVRYHAEMQVTTVDSPNLMKFVRSNYPQVNLNLPKLNMIQLIQKKKMLPTRIARYYCEYLKEGAGAGTVTVVGIRAKESVKRAKRNRVEVLGERGKGFYVEGDKLYTHNELPNVGQMFEQQTDTQVYCVGGKDKVVISPIFDWYDSDVWAFLNHHNISHCDLYDKGFRRIGCLFCPMASSKEKKKELEMFPRFAEKVYIRAIRELMKQGQYGQFRNANDVFDWWLSGLSANEWQQHYSPSLFDDIK